MDQYDLFVLGMYPTIKEVCSRYNLPPEVCATQAAIESAWGNSIIGEWNMWGRKWGGWGEFKLVTTQECYDGVWTTINDKFQLYDNLEQAIDDWCQLMLWGNYKQYADQYQLDGDVEDFVEGIASIYATDGEYANKIISTMRILETDGVFS